VSRVPTLIYNSFRAHPVLLFSLLTRNENILPIYLSIMILCDRDGYAVFNNNKLSELPLDLLTNINTK